MGKELTLKGQSAKFFQVYFLLFISREKDVISQTSFRKQCEFKVPN